MQGLIWATSRNMVAIVVWIGCPSRKCNIIRRHIHSIEHWRTIRADSNIHWSWCGKSYIRIWWWIALLCLKRFCSRSRAIIIWPRLGAVMHIADCPKRVINVITAWTGPIIVPATAVSSGAFGSRGVSVIYLRHVVEETVIDRRIQKGNILPQLEAAKEFYPDDRAKRPKRNWFSAIKPSRLQVAGK